VDSPWRREVEEKWARGLFQTQSGVELRLYVQCRGGEEVCEKRAYPLVVFLFFSFFFFCNQIVIMFKVQKTHAALAMEIKNL